MLKQNLGRVIGKTEPTENLENWTNRKLTSMVFPVSMEYQCWPLWKNWKVATILLISIIQKNFKLLTPHQSLGLWFSECWQKQNISVSHYEKIENGCHFVNIDHTEKFQITDSPQSLGLRFYECWWNGISALAIMKKLKNGYHFINIHHTEKFQITNPPKFGSLVFFSECWWKRNIIGKPEMQIFFFPNFPLDHFLHHPS